MPDQEENDLDVARLKFAGGRYEKPGYPLEGIDELERYQRLIQCAAKHIWREANPKRKRLPANFEERVRLRLRYVLPGSVVPVLAPDVDTMSEEGSILSKSIDLIDEIFEQIVKHVELPEWVDDEFSQAIRGFGGSLANNEYSTFRAGSAHEVRYGRAERKALIDAMKTDAEPLSGALIGRIEMLDVGLKFALIDPNGRRIPGEFTESSLFEDMHDVHHLSETAGLVWLDCTFSTDDGGYPTRVLDVYRVGPFAHSSNEWALRLARVASLPKGWLDGAGDRVHLDAIISMLALIESLQQHGFARPSIFADEEGGLRLEWLTDASHTVAGAGPSGFFSLYHLNVSTGEERFEPDQRARDVIIEMLSELVPHTGEVADA